MAWELLRRGFSAADGEAGLVLVHEPIEPFYENIKILVQLQVEDGLAHARGEGIGLGGPVGSLDIRLDPGRDFVEDQQIGRFEYHDELVAAVAGDKVGLAHGGVEDVGHLDKGLVADAVAALVVDLLEIVEVEHDAGEGPLAASAAEEPGKVFLQARPVEGSRQVVAVDLPVLHVDEGEQHGDDGGGPEEVGAVDEDLEDAADGRHYGVEDQVQEGRARYVLVALDEQPGGQEAHDGHEEVEERIHRPAVVDVSFVQIEKETLERAHRGEDDAHEGEGDGGPEKRREEERFRRRGEMVDVDEVDPHRDQDEGEEDRVDEVAGDPARGSGQPVDDPCRAFADDDEPDADNQEEKELGIDQAVVAVPHDDRAADDREDGEREEVYFYPQKGFDRHLLLSGPLKHGMNERGKDYSTKGVGDCKARCYGGGGHDRGHAELRHLHGVALEGGEHGEVHAAAGDEGDDAGDHVDGGRPGPAPTDDFAVEAGRQGGHESGERGGCGRLHRQEGGPADGGPR